MNRKQQIRRQIELYRKQLETGAGSDHASFFLREIMRLDAILRHLEDESDKRE